MQNDIYLTYVNEIKSYKLLTPEEEADLSKKIAEGSEYARKELVNSNFRLVISIAKKFCDSNMLGVRHGRADGVIQAIQSSDLRRHCRTEGTGERASAGGKSRKNRTCISFLRSARHGKDHYSKGFRTRGKLHQSGERQPVQRMPDMQGHTERQHNGCS